MKSLAILTASAIGLTAASILFFALQACASGTCGECYVSGIKGTQVWDNGSQSCKICP